MTSRKQNSPVDFMSLLSLIAKDVPSPKARERRKKPVPQHILQLKISLKHVKPLIWRRILVADNDTLGDLHDVIQTVMGWYGGHLHAFRMPSRGFGPPAMTFDNEEGNEQTTFLSEVLFQKGRKLIYEYDFGDGWEHDILLEKLIPFDPAAPLPFCLAGARACPPEDCGGFPGYYGILEALKDPKTPENAVQLEWVGEFDPEAFDLDAVSKRLRRR
ncbi:MAG: plasmid pRiA4b ORF-3 family protein [bacterium]